MEGPITLGKGPAILPVFGPAKVATRSVQESLTSES